VFLLNSRRPLLFAELIHLASLERHLRGGTPYLEQRASLPSSFSDIIPHALAFFAHPPVSVYGTVRDAEKSNVFLSRVKHLLPSQKGSGRDSRKKLLFTFYFLHQYPDVRFFRLRLQKSFFKKTFL